MSIRKLNINHKCKTCKQDLTQVSFGYTERINNGNKVYTVINVRCNLCRWRTTKDKTRKDKLTFWNNEFKLYFRRVYEN